MALAWWLVPCLPFPGLPHIYFLFTVRLRIFHVCRNENFRNSYLSFYWKKWFYIWYMALAWWLVPCLPFPGLPHIYFLFTVRLTNEQVGVFLARRGVQHLVMYCWTCSHSDYAWPIYHWILSNSCSFCWYWWNCWPSLLKLSFHNQLIFLLFILHFPVNIGQQLLQALLEHWPKTHIFEGQGKNVKFSIHIAKKVIMRYIEIEQSWKNLSIGIKLIDFFSFLYYLPLYNIPVLSPFIQYSCPSL
jgi:hypothetical protein